MNNFSVLVQHLVCNVESHSVVKTVWHRFSFNYLVDVVEPDVTSLLQLKNVVRLSKILGKDIIY